MSQYCYVGFIWLQYPHSTNARNMDFICIMGQTDRWIDTKLLLYIYAGHSIMKL